MLADLSIAICSSFFFESFPKDKLPKKCRYVSSQSKQNIKFSVLPSADFLSDINSGRVDVDNERHNTQYDGSCIQSIAHNKNNGIATDKKGFLENEIKTHRATGGA